MATSSKGQAARDSIVKLSEIVERCGRALVDWGIWWQVQELPLRHNPPPPLVGFVGGQVAALEYVDQPRGVPCLGRD